MSCNWFIENRRQEISTKIFVFFDLFFPVFISFLKAVFFSAVSNHFHVTKRKEKSKLFLPSSSIPISAFITNPLRITTGYNTATKQNNKREKKIQGSRREDKQTISLSLLNQAENKQLENREPFSRSQQEPEEIDRCSLTSESKKIKRKEKSQLNLAQVTPLGTVVIRSVEIISTIRGKERVARRDRLRVVTWL